LQSVFCRNDSLRSSLSYASGEGQPKVIKPFGIRVWKQVQESS
jgi:hypothetical protein